MGTEGIREMPSSVMVPNTIKNEKVLFLFSKGWAKNHIVASFIDFLTNTDDVTYEKLYLDLIGNLDDDSIRTVNRILVRIMICNRLLFRNQSSNCLLGVDVFDEKEKEEIREVRKNLEQNIQKISDRCFLWERYLLPVNHFEACVFYYRHEIDRVNRDYFKHKDICDVGGFIGDSAIVLSAYTDRKVYSFEPTSRNYDLLLKTIEMNRKNNIVPVKLGLSDRIGESTMSYCGSGSSLHFEKDSVDESLETETVNLTTLDSYVEEHGLDVGLIKTDLEGAEMEFLRGAEKTIKKFKPTLLISIYHKPEDFFLLKPLIESWNLGYNFKIVRSSDGGILGETLLLAEVVG